MEVFRLRNIKILILLAFQIVIVVTSSEHQHKTDSRQNFY